MSKLTKARIELFWWKFMMVGFFLISGDLFYHHSLLVGGMSLCFGLTALEAVIENANRITAIQRNRINDC